MDEFDEEASTLPQNARDVGLEDTPVAQPLRRAGTEVGWAAPPLPKPITRHAAIMRAITALKIE